VFGISASTIADFKQFFGDFISGFSFVVDMLGFIMRINATFAHEPSKETYQMNPTMKRFEIL
jgi:hypothetical protein